MIIRKNDSKVFLIIYCINIKTLLILINYQKGYTILIKKKGELSFGGRWAPKLTKCPHNSSNWVEGYEIVTDKYTL